MSSMSKRTPSSPNLALPMKSMSINDPEHPHNKTPYRASHRFAKFYEINRERMQKIMHRGDTVEFETDDARRKAAFLEKELYDLQLEHNKLMRRQAELVYLLEDLYLQEQMDKVKVEFTRIANLPRWAKGDQTRREERILMRRLLMQVNERDQLLGDLDVERLREKEEEHELIIEYIQKKERWFSDPKFKNLKLKTNTVRWFYPGDWVPDSMQECFHLKGKYKLAKRPSAYRLPNFPEFDERKMCRIS